MSWKNPTMRCEDCEEDYHISTARDQAAFVYVHGVMRGCKRYGYTHSYSNNPPRE